MNLTKKISVLLVLVTVVLTLGCLCCSCGSPGDYFSDYDDSYANDWLNPTLSAQGIQEQTCSQ